MLVVPLLNAGDIGAGVVDVCVGDDELDIVGDRVGDVLIFIWAAVVAENMRPDEDKSRGSIDDNMSRSRSISHFRLVNPTTSIPHATKSNGIKKMMKKKEREKREC